MNEFLADIENAKANIAMIAKDFPPERVETIRRIVQNAISKRKGHLDAADGTQLVRAAQAFLVLMSALRLMESVNYYRDAVERESN